MQSAARVEEEYLDIWKGAFKSKTPTKTLIRNTQRKKLENLHIFSEKSKSYSKAMVGFHSVILQAKTKNTYLQ